MEFSFISRPITPAVAGLKKRGQKAAGKYPQPTPDLFDGVDHFNNPLEGQDTNLLSLQIFKVTSRDRSTVARDDSLACRHARTRGRYSLKLLLAQLALC
jgi:hypothetical protein